MNGGMRDDYLEYYQENKTEDDQTAQEDQEIQDKQGNEASKDGKVYYKELQEDKSEGHDRAQDQESRTPWNAETEETDELAVKNAGTKSRADIMHWGRVQRKANHSTDAISLMIA